MNVAIYIDGNRLDMFDDESINFVAKAVELNDLSKIFMDFTQTFSVPASKLNNYVFQHYYNADIDGTFNANLRIPAYIEIGTIPFRTGKIQLENVKLKDNGPELYKITFYGDLKNLSDLFGNDKLQDLGKLSTSTGTTNGIYNDNPILSKYDHIYEPANVESGLNNPTWEIDGNVIGEDLIYPLISPQRVWRIGTGDDENEISATDPGVEGQIMDIYTAKGAIDYGELKPALRITNIIEAIEYKYGVEFSKDFFGSAAFKDLFMWCSNGSGYMKPYGQPEISDFTSITSNITSNGGTVNYSTNTLSFTVNASVSDAYRLYFTVEPLNGYDSIPYKMMMVFDGDFENAVTVDNQTGEQRLLWNITSEQLSANKTYNIQFYVTSAKDFIYTPRISFQKNSSIGTVYCAQSVAEGKVRMVEQLPDIKVMDWLGGIMKMFNLIIRPTSSTTFKITTMNDYYSGGEIFDITQYVDIAESEISRPELKKVVNFKYSKTENILGANFRDTYGGISEVGYGDLRAEYNIDSTNESMTVELPFENMMFERLTDNTMDELSGQTPVSNIVIGSAFNKEYKSNNVMPVLFYNNGISSLDTPIKLKYNDNLGDRVDIDRLYVIGNENSYYSNMISNTINFGVEYSPFFKTLPVYEDGNERYISLYNNYWDNYISNAYNQKQRKYSLSAYLPINIMQKLSLDDRLNIGDRQYRINDYNLNLLNGSVKLNLIGNYYDAPYPIVNEGISLTNYVANPLTKSFDIVIDSDSTWTTSKSAVIGSSTDWVSLSQSVGEGKKTVTVTLTSNVSAVSSTALRVVNLVFTTNGNSYSCQIKQNGLTY